MREAIGGALLIYLIIPIIILIIVFIGFIMNYASAYRAANYVVTQIESCQGRVSGDCASYPSDGAIGNAISSKYRYNGNIKKTCVSLGANTSMYNVELAVEFELPIIGKFSPFAVKVDTKTLHGGCSK